MSKKVRIINTQEGDWEGIYLDDRLLLQGHKIERMELLELAEKHRFKSTDISFPELEDEDEKDTSISGRFPDDINEFKHSY